MRKCKKCGNEMECVKHPLAQLWGEDVGNYVGNYSVVWKCKVCEEKKEKENSEKK